MKNPWKRLSKINPQREDGTRQINSAVLNSLVKAKLPTAEMGIILTIISKTWGFNKKEDAISISQISEATGFTSRAIQKANKALVKKRILIVGCSKRVYRGSPLNLYMFNKHYDTWKIQDTKRVNSSTGGELSGNKRVNSSTPTIETITIEKKEIYKESHLGIFKKKVLIPDNYSIQPNHIKYALTKKLSEDQAKDQFEAFKAHHQAKGTKYQNWYAAYQTWIRNSIAFGRVTIKEECRIETPEESNEEVNRKLYG